MQESGWALGLAKRAVLRRHGHQIIMKQMGDFLVLGGLASRHRYCDGHKMIHNPPITNIYELNRRQPDNAAEYLIRRWSGGPRGKGRATWKALARIAHGVDGLGRLLADMMHV